MTALKASEIDAFVNRPNPAQPVVLICGPDSGLVRERTEKIVAVSVEDVRDPFALVRLEGDALASEPTRLVEEASTVPLFGGRRAIWIKGGNRNFAAAVEPVLAEPPKDCRIVIEAGDLRRTAPLRSLCEKSKFAAVLPCYVDTERDLVRLVDNEMSEAKLAIAPDARAALVSLIGGDRAASRSELRKLALYAHGQERVVLDDVLAVVADASALALDAVIDAAFAGKTGDLETRMTKALAADTAPGTIVSGALRYVTQLHKARVALDSGGDQYTAMRSFIPPIHFKREAAVTAALRAWTAPRLERAMQQLADAALNVRRTPKLGESLAQRALLSIAMMARRSSR